MPQRTDISSILVFGAGPIAIGQACLTNAKPVCPRHIEVAQNFNEGN